MNSEYIRNEFDPESRSLRKSRRLLVGALAAGLALGGCTQDVQPNPAPQGIERPAPESDDYFLDINDPYYLNVKKALPLAEAPTVKANIERLLQTPVAQWLNGSTEQTVQIIKENIALSAKDGGIPTFVAYNIPFRDLGGASSGGIDDGADYKGWVDAISEAIGEHSSIIVLEPDALAGVPHMNDQSMQTERIELLRYALQKMKNENPNTAVYLDGGHSKWHDAETTAGLIKKVDPTGEVVKGVSFNVSNQRPEDEVRRYADAVEASLGYGPYVLIDNSMNGAVNTAELLDWCNIAGEKMGTLDDAYFDKNARVEEVYIKAPGESDAACGTSTAPAGVFDNELLFKQAS